MMWSRFETSTHTKPIRVCGPNNGREVLFPPNGENVLDACRRLDAKGWRLNLWLTTDARSLLDVPCTEQIYFYAAGQTLNGTLLKRLLTVRTEWSRK